MPVENIRNAILDTLKDLESNEYREFCDKLTDPEESPCIRASEVENKTRGKMVKFLISRCTEKGALRRTVSALLGIGCNNEARTLKSECNTRSQGEKKRSSVRSPGPALKSLDNQTNKELKQPQKMKREEAKVERSQTSVNDVLIFGQYKGKRFQWLLQNHVEYAAYVVGTHQIERENGYKSQTELMKNKDALAEYLSGFPHAVEEVHFYREGLAPLGFGKYKTETRQNLYNSKDEEKQRYVKWLRSMEEICTGAQMKEMIKYIRHRDKKVPLSTCSRDWPQRSSTKRRAPPEPSSQPAVKKQQL